MQRKWQGFLRPMKNRILSGVLALSLVIGGVGIAPIISGAANHVDLDNAMSIKVTMPEMTDGNQAFLDDLAKANVVVDMYKLATAVDMKGYAGYEVEATDAFSSIADLMKIDAKDADKASVDAVSKEIADSAYDLVAAGAITPDYAGIALDSAVGVEGGIYLILPRSEDVTDISKYFKTVVSTEGDSNKVTVAKSGIYEYQFSPIVAALPYMVDETTGMMYTYDFGSGEWLYNIAVALKCGREALYGDLEITKTLNTLVNGVDGAFVFDIEAVDVDGNNVYSNVVTMFFNKGTSQNQTVTIKNLPAGAEVTVTEVYSGASYQLAAGSAGTQTAVITAEEIQRVSFVNDIGKYRKGGAITNSFHYNNGEWEWTQLTETEDVYYAIEIDEDGSAEPPVPVAPADMPL